MPIKKVENEKIIICKIKCTDSFRFLSSLLSSLVDNLSEGPHNDKFTDCKSYFEYMSTKDELLIFNGLKCSKEHREHFSKSLTKIYQLCDEFCLILIKDVFHTNIWIAGKDLMKHCCLIKKIFRVI